MSPSISQKNYEVGAEVVELFDDKYYRVRDDKFLLDVTQANYDMLTNFGVPEINIEKSTSCSYDENYLHSYRREGKYSWRAFGVIAMK